MPVARRHSEAAVSDDEIDCFEEDESARCNRRIVDDELDDEVDRSCPDDKIQSSRSPPYSAAPIQDNSHGA
jgi:hypothetical protein